MQLKPAKAAASPDSGAALGAALLTAAMALPLAAPVRAETAPDRGTISLKHLDYQDSQPGESRIRVDTTALMVVAPVAGEWSVGASVISDTISGASPGYHTAFLKRMSDRRRAADGDVTRYFANGTVSLGASVSSESDYLSRGLSLKASRSSEDKNTTWTAGVAYSSDQINPTNRVVSDETKRVIDLLLGVSQILTMTDIVQLSLGRSSGRGYYSDPYKLLDNRPRVHDSSTITARWNHHVETGDGTARLSYRYYSDSWGIKAHTLGMEYVQPVGAGWTVTPLLRLYTQSAADFYLSEPPQGPFIPSPADDAVYYSGDQRVSAFGARTVGVKLAKRLNADWLVDVKYEHYRQRASWRQFGAGSPDLATFNARSLQLGVTLQF